MATANTLRVLLGDADVGELQGARDGSVTFRFLPSYLQRGARPVLGQWFEDRLGEDIRSKQRLPPWFSNLLPEGALRDLLTRRHNIQRAHEFEILAVLGTDDLPGNIRVLPATASDVLDLDDGARLDPPARDALFLKFSLAGVQLKFSAVQSGRGLTIPAKGAAGDFIVKLPDARYAGVPENEFAMMTWAAAAGLDVARVSLHTREHFAGVPEEFFTGVTTQPALAVRRFDRAPEGRRVHMEDMAQVRGLYPAEKYDQTNFETLVKIVSKTAGDADALEMLRRIIFNAVIGNGDAHTKNWSFLYEHPQRARISPAYDLVSTMAYLENERSALNFSGTKDWSALDQAALERFSRKTGLDGTAVVENIRAFLDRVVAAWDAGHAGWPVPRPLLQKIADHWTSVPLLHSHRAGLNLR